jgi:hypothetical protein
MEMDLLAHCGEVNRGGYVHSLVLTDIASGGKIADCAAQSPELGSPYQLVDEQSTAVFHVQ